MYFGIVGVHDFSNINDGMQEKRNIPPDAA